MQQGNNYVNRKVSAKLTLFNRQVKELAGCSLSPELKVWAINHLQKEFATSDLSFTDDMLIFNLMNNVTRGKVREIFRRLKADDPIGYNRVIPEIAEYVNKDVVWTPQ
jgi:hypothetical protein